MKPAAREQWILDYLAAREKRVGGFPCSLDVLNADFVDDYAEATGAKLLAVFVGAHKCPQLGADLSRMAKKGLLERHTTGIQDGLCHMGFPRWVWVYWFPKKKSSAMMA